MWNTIGQYMKELNTLVANVADNFLTKEVLLNTRTLYIEANKLKLNPNFYKHAWVETGKANTKMRSLFSLT